jgi:hypothetical protein
MDNSDKLSVIAGFAAGIALVAAFSIEFSGSSLALAKGLNEINLTLDGMKETYKPGEQIIFSVSANGISDNACNVGSPSVTIYGGSKESRVNWPLSFGFNTALMCSESETLDRKWTFGEAENEFALDVSGTYTIVASIEGVTIEKQFVVKG